MTDLFLPAAPKDYVKIAQVIKAVSKYVPDIGRVCIVTPDAFQCSEMSGLQIDYYTDAEILPDWYKRSSISYRPNWMTQQIIKLIQQVTQSEYWLTIDADMFFIKSVELFNAEGKPILYTGLDQHYPPYFQFNQSLLGIGKLRQESFISECTLYKRQIVDELMAYCGGRDSFIRKTIEIINTRKGHPAESEIYAAFVLSHYPNLYEIQKLSKFVTGRFGTGEYSENDIIRIGIEYEEAPFQTFCLHSWSETWN